MSRYFLIFSVECVPHNSSILSELDDLTYACLHSSPQNAFLIIKRLLTCFSASPYNVRDRKATKLIDSSLTAGQGHLACVTYGGEKSYGRRRHLYFYDDPVKSDIQLLSYYINKFKQEKAQGLREPTKGI